MNRSLRSVCYLRVAILVFVLSVDVSIAKDRLLEPESDTKRRNYLDQQIPAWLEEHNVPSVAITFVSSGKIAWTEAYGQQAPGAKASEATLYNTASLTKPMVSEIVLLLAEQNQLSLDEPMSAYWIDPDIEHNPWHEILTPRIALTHQTGFKNWRRQSGGVLSFAWQPGSRTGYSGEGFEYVARFLERRLDKPFERIAEDVLFEPSGMKDSSFVREPWFNGRLAFRMTSEGEWGQPVTRDEPSGAGDVWTTTEDYARFVLGVMDRLAGPDAEEAARSAISRDEVQRWCGPGKTPLEICPERMGFAIGWYIYEYEDHTLFAHSGSNDGERTLALFVPARGMGLVVFTNGDNGGRVISRILRVLYGNEEFITLEGF